MYEIKPLEKENIKTYKKLRRIFVKYKIKTLRNHGESPGNKKMFYNLFNSIISRASNNINHFIVMQSDNKIIGFASISTKSKDVVNVPYDYGEVNDFYISPKFRRKGYGKILNEYIEDVFKQNGTYVALLSPDPVSGIAFWKAVGYRDTGIHHGWGKHFVYIKHIKANENSARFDKAIQAFVTSTDLISINPYNKKQIKETVLVWKKYCEEHNQRFRKNDVKKTAFIARKNKFVSFKALYYEGRIIGFNLVGDKTVKYILPEYRNICEKELIP